MTKSIFILAALFLSLAYVAFAQSEGFCTNESVAGTWAWTETGSLIPPAGPVIFTAVGATTRDVDGTITGWTVRSTGGVISRYTIKGTGTVNPDCTGSVTVRLYDQTGNLFSTATLSGVYTNNATEHYQLVTSSLRADGTNMPTALLMIAKKMFPPRPSGM